ncbi:bifunctional oligoribonuclease/PAP phosphatase NrnA [Bombilactobacillus folatiphilus]|uniref:Bifunctional oligoribonuclease/PAP phosphatase NrnA n=1 Tax=Bombilactobacillus folatiphilus TaxID=2923362 RepID=A0ABY4P9N3_9LACO|nr:bifunctional oligoribonuclease/PAP phosphatase NrnA [Bombilactobacillus folatiphilus]UQS82453.1 bifunctional oligoribonuclease/PAP phosphatase NrnA [Bombilactobacillus folatiphilus]
MNTFGEILDQIQKYDRIIIHRHENPDPDALGSQLGLATSIRAAYPDKTVLLAGDSVGDLDWLSTMDQIEDQQYPGALVIVVDTANRPRISDQRYDQGACLIKIDHHPDVDPYGYLRYVNTSASSCSEIIGDLINSAGHRLCLTDQGARALYAGIVGDTGRFMYDATTSHTLALAAQLIGYRFDAPALNRHMGQITLNQAKLQGYVFEHLELAPNGAALTVIPAEILAKLELTQADAHAVVTTPGRLQGVLAWVIAVAKPEGGYRIHLRSKAVVINDLAALHDGGGHPLASGANAQDLVEVQQIFTQLQEKLLS